MTVNRLIVGDLQTNCYILESGKEGIIIDPGAEIEKIIRASSELEIKLIIATHNHFDHIDGIIELKNATGVSSAIHPMDWVKGFDQKLIDGQELKFGEECIKVIHTPGHTPGSCCFLVNDVLFSGDTLFPFGPGNTLLPGGDEGGILSSIREKLLMLPDETKVYPGHGPTTKIGNERELY